MAASKCPDCGRSRVRERRMSATPFPWPEESVLRLAAILRSSAQRIVVPFLALVSVTMIVLGKIDEVMFGSIRISVTDKAAPALDLLSRPLSAIEDFGRRARAFVNTYQQNLYLSEENQKLLHSQQTALLLEAENVQLGKLMKVIPELLSLSRQRG
jgi:cell shape-determining protein MreC